MVFIAGKLCDPCLSVLKWFVYHARRYTNARLFYHLSPSNSVLCSSLHLPTAAVPEAGCTIHTRDGQILTVCQILSPDRIRISGA